MWTSKINNVITNYYSEFYTSRERNYYKINVFDCVVGGTRGLKILLDEPISSTDPYELYSPTDIVADARKICDDFYDRTCDPLSRVSTSIINKEIKIEVSGRLISTVFNESTTFHSSVEKEVLEPEKNIPQPYSLKIDKLKEEIIAEKAYTKYKIISPHLYIIDLLKKLNDPFEQKNKKDNMEIIDKLLKITPSKYFEGTYYSIENEVNAALSIFRKDLVNLLKDNVFIGFRNNLLILMSSKNTEEEFNNLFNYTKDCKKFNIILPNELFLSKASGKYKYKPNVHICVYNIGYYQVVPINNYTHDKIGSIKIATSCLRSRIFMIEDNIVMSLQARGISNIKLNYMSYDDLNEAFSEEYPIVYNLDEVNELFENRFYGIYRNMSTMKKIFIKEFNKVGPYYPYVNRYRQGKECTGALKKELNFDAKWIDLSKPIKKNFTDE
jgi:hypothetical protein